MKLTTILMLVCCMQISAKSISQNITLKVRDAPLTKVFHEIKKQTGYTFIYTASMLREAKRVSITVSNSTIQEVLALCFTGQPFSYQIINKTVVVEVKAAGPIPTAAGSLTLTPVLPPLPPPVEIKGRVTDENGNPLAGVSVTLKGSDAIGTTTNDNGEYSLTLENRNGVLVFSSVGHTTREISISGRMTVNAILQTTTSSMEDVVVVGYGTKLKGELTGAVSTVTNKVFEDRPVTNAMNGMQGAMSGVTITRGSGRPGDEGYNVDIRGASSINGNKPLILIDGVPGDINLINPNDIENITVLKDAAAAIYGARAADGVIIVTTKRGIQGPPRVSYSGNIGVKTPHFLKKKTNTLEFAEMYDNGMRNAGQLGLTEDIFDKIKRNAPPDPTGYMIYLENYPGFYGSHDWNKEVYKSGLFQSHNLNISGGNDRSNYLFSLGYQKNEGILQHTENNSQRYNIRLNYDFKISERLKVETRTSFESEPVVEPTALYMRPFIGADFREGVFFWTLWFQSYVPVYNPSGEFYKYQGGFKNPVQYLVEAGTTTNNAYRFTPNIKANYHLLKGLDLVGQAAVSLDFGNSKKTRPTFTQWNWDGSVFDVVNNPNSATFRDSSNIYQSYTAYLDYNKVFSKQRLGIMVGTSHEINSFAGQEITGYNFASNDIFTLNLADRTKADFADFSGSKTEWALQSYFGRLSYSFDSKYLLDFTLRADGSSKFSKEKRWSSIYPSIMGAWNLSDENFLKNSAFVNSLRLRLSWGKAGNQDLSFGNYDYIPLITISNANTALIGNPGVLLPGAISNIASVNRTWETIETKNIGVDFAFIESRLFGSIDLYQKNNNDMLVSEELPATLGGIAPTQNLGKLRTRGWDLSVGWRDRKGDFRYSILAMVSDNKNKLIDLKGTNVFGEGLNFATQGYPLNSYFGYKAEGIIQNTDELNKYKQEVTNAPAGLGVGDVKYADIDNDGLITAFGDGDKNKGDLVYLGNLSPRYLFSSNIDLAYRGFELSILLQGVGKRKAIKDGEFSRPFRWVWDQPLQWFYGRTWTPDNPDARYPRLMPGSVGVDQVNDWNWRYNSIRVDNLAYLRLKVLTLAYNFSNTLVKKIKLNGLRMYVSGQDILTFASKNGTWDGSFDPEEIWERLDPRTYPFNRTVVFGLDIKF